MIKAKASENIRLCSILCSASFLLGTIFTHWIADHGTLWQTPTSESLSTALSYYRNLVSAPESMKMIIPIVASVGMMSLLIGLYNGFGGDSAWVFEFASLFLFSTAIAVYYSHALEPLSNIPLANDERMPPPYQHHNLHPPDHPPSLSPFDTPDVLLPSTPSYLISSIRDIAAAHLLSAVCLTGVLLFLAGNSYVDYEREIKQNVQD
ncbi:hypothetical protein E3Q19_01775 [Wallemia mellicola]|nr:hypothetical protein E3Q19_01775 [Wallemia mellicola]